MQIITLKFYDALEQSSVMWSQPNLFIYLWGLSKNYRPLYIFGHADDFSQNMAALACKEGFPLQHEQWDSSVVASVWLHRLFEVDALLNPGARPSRRLPFFTLCPRISSDNRKSENHGNCGLGKKCVNFVDFLPQGTTIKLIVIAKC